MILKSQIEAYLKILLLVIILKRITYFTSKTALSLMLLDEYGSVQQHLQPRHIQEMLIPIQIKDIVEMDDSEVEDIIPYELINRGITRMFISVEDVGFEDEYKATEPIIPQIEEFAKKHSVELVDGWKVELSKSFKQALKNKKIDDISNSYTEKWVKLFKVFE